MSWTKRQFVTQAFEEIGYASYVYDLAPEQLQSALRKLDAMMALWNSKGIRIGYPIPSNPENSDLDEETNVPDSANEAIYSNLAIKLAPTVGKIVAIETKQSAHQAYINLLSISAKPNEQQITGLPRGAGAKATGDVRGPFLDEAQETLDAGNDATIDFY